ncbi:MAG: hypothetical protein KDK40_04335, partial [Chlamydiia bacterium]|nr:hypothetical protein [Chlamydiia bacterium]
MLHMFRRYERAMFIVIAIVIIISFSFFGTYSTFQGHHYEDPVVFTTLNKHPVKRSELDQVIVFIGTDSTDKRNLGGARGANGLNDGFIANDLLKTGLASLLIGQMREQLSQELRMRLEKEKQFSFYTHPQAPFISAQSLWGMFAPQIGHNLSGLRAVTDPTSEDGLKARAELYLAERQFPEMNLKQLVRYQERQFPWVRPDPDLAQLDLSLFGYHTVGDWYGSDFVKLAAEFLIDAAELAEQAGYEVSDNEALADLQRIASDSLSQLRRLPQYEQLLPSQYLNEQLAQMRLDEPRAVAIWKQVLLFRRLFHGTGNAVLVDTLPYEQFNSFALESISGERFSLADSLQFGDLNALARFETYLNLVAAKPSQGSLELPTEAKAIAVLAKQTPELVQKRYLVETASVTLTALQSRVSVKEMWDWQTSDKGWNQLVREFPQLSFAKNSQPPQTDNERFQALKAVQESTRTKIDEFSRLAIIREHPEWVDEALDAEKMERKIYSIRLKGGPSPIEGLSDRSALLA